MPTVNLPIPFYLPPWLYKKLRSLKDSWSNTVAPAATVPNLVGDRDIEWSWIGAQIPSGPGEALDFGHGGSILALIAAHKGFTVTAIDLEKHEWTYVHPRLRFVQGDLLENSFDDESFDLIINCSTVEHVGLAGRYGVTEDRSNGDLDAMARLRQLMKPLAVMLLTIPVGRDKVVSPLHRVYGPQRLPLVLDGYIVEEEIYWGKNLENRWVQFEKEVALNLGVKVDLVNLQNNYYGLGCFVLKKPSS